MPEPILIFISHSSEDVALATLLIDLIRAALNIPAAQIRCTSVDGYRLPIGANTNEQLRREVHETKAFIGIISPASSRSAYVMFELGARWGAERHLSPVLAPGVDASILRGPIAGLNALRADRLPELLQLVDDLGAQLDLRPGSAASYHNIADRITQLAPARESNIAANTPGEEQFSRPLNLPERDQVASVTTEARELLIAAANLDHGDVFVTDGFDGISVTVGEREFVTPKGNARAAAKAKRALDELVSAGLIANRGGDGSLFGVTDEGFRVADLIQRP